ncbi:MAG: glycosyltransferase [Flavobacteriales bacterium]
MHAQLGDGYEEYVPMGRLMFLGAVPFGFFIGMRSVLDAYYRTPRNGINLMTGFLLLALVCAAHLLLHTSPFFVGAGLVAVLYVVGWLTWRDVGNIRLQLERRSSGDRSLRIVVVIPALEEQVTAYPFARRQAEAFRVRHGADVHLFYLASRTSPLKLLMERRRLKRLLRTVRPDVVHAHYGSVSGLLTVLSSSVPVVIAFHGSDLNRTPQDGFLRDLLGRFFSQMAAFFCAGMTCVSERLRERLWWRREEAVVLPLGVDPEVFEPMDRAQCREELGWGTEHIVLFNANNPGVKRLDIAEATMAHMAAQGMPATLKALKGSVDSDRIPLLLNAADALLLCSDTEGSPTMVKEAMGCGLPVVANDVGDVRERTRDVTPGAVVAQDPAQLATALMEILADGRRSNGPALLARNGADARVQDARAFEHLREMALPG